MTIKESPEMEYVDPRLLRYFAVVAEEGSVRKAAEKLFISQPPLTRQIRQLEETLGITLFTRHSKGVALTHAGHKALELVLPFLRMQEKTMRHIAALATAARESGGVVRVGLTTAFEQGIFAGLEVRLREKYTHGLKIVRASSPKLARELRKGRLDAAFVALPLETPELIVTSTGYAEPLEAALPSHWALTAQNPLHLRQCNGKPLFWFKRDSNAAFFDYTRSVFIHAGYSPLVLEEPAEHDVLLARIASGEGMGLMPQSFAAITRRGVRFVPLAETGLLQLQLGIAALPGKNALLDEMRACFYA